MIGGAIIYNVYVYETFGISKLKPFNQSTAVSEKIVFRVDK